MAVKNLKKFRRKNHFDAIAFTGTSGAALAYPISYLLRVPLICVRKSTRDNHSGLKLEGCISSPTYIIVDDFIESGRTVLKIKKAIKAENKKANCVGIYLYSNCGWREIDSFKGITLI